MVALWHQSSWARIAAAVILLFCGWLAFSPVESPEGLTARMAEINERVPQKFQYTKKNNIAGAEKPAMRMAEESTPTEIQTERVSGPAPLAFLPVSEAISSFQVDIIASTSSVSTFAPWTDSEDDLPVPSPVNTSIWEQLARRGVDELLNLDRDPNESLTSALIDKATSKLNESDRVLVQLPGPKPEKQLAGWKVRLGQLQVAKQDR